MFKKEVNETSVKKLQVQADFMKQIAEATKNPEVIKLLKKWIGKKITKRLQTELQKIDKHFYIDTTYSTCYLEYNFYDMNERSFEVADSEWSVYVDEYKFNLLSLNCSNDYTIRENIEEVIENTSNKFLENYVKLTHDIHVIDSIISTYNGIVNSYNNLMDNTHYMIKHEFKL